MTIAQINAFKEISQFGERLTANDLNITARTMTGMIKRGWIERDGSKVFITRKGSDALTAAGF